MRLERNGRGRLGELERVGQNSAGSGAGVLCPERARSCPEKARACSELCALSQGEEIELAVGGFGSSVSLDYCSMTIVSTCLL